MTGFLHCEITETCASCIDPDFTVFAFDTTATGFAASEIDSFYIIAFPRGQLNAPLDTSDLLIEQNPFIIGGSLLGTSTLDSDYVIESPNQEFRFEITDLGYTIISVNDNCRCDVVDDKTLQINGELTTLSEPFESVLLSKQ